LGQTTSPGGTICFVKHIGCTRQNSTVGRIGYQSLGLKKKKKVKQKSMSLYVRVKLRETLLSPFPLHIHSPPSLGPNIPRGLSPGHDHWGGNLTPPQLWAGGSITYDPRATAPPLFVFVLSATYSMLHRDLTPCLSPSQHSLSLEYDHTSLPPPLCPHPCTP